jgi:hypothetical protein
MELRTEPQNVRSMYSPNESQIAVFRKASWRH